MLGLLVIIVVSWGLLYLIEKKNITALGIVPNQKRVIQFLLGFLFISIITLCTIYIETLIKSIVWESKSVDYALIYKSLLYHFRSALTEDLVFRGAILYILISKIGAKKAIFISALFFGIYHVFSYGMIEGSIILILYVILITGCTGYVWAYAFEKTKSIALGLGFHLGCNLISVFFFPSQPYGELLFVKVSGVSFSEWNELYFLLFKGLFPSVLTFLFLKLMLKSNFKFFKND
ncbi:MAG: CAAX protease family protein [Flavobacterium sp. MedPE-SWcel]|uniref:CPBP family intramembrane glutamic endopeptidase n=1 Tax=uncultured Flavobacterium sp. TaxID=165435 RepID=UPI00091158BA|nr:CPBP family intramembrane glutamic endopeptidase [uncultured Flavobacterium sp.]OIQ16204.1 MAG: CAAX protease family protein [Flavobacterium sp. MedPE-SWcel]